MKTIDKLIEYIETFQDEDNWSNEIWLIKVAAIKLKENQGQTLPIPNVGLRSEQLPSCEKCGYYTHPENKTCLRVGCENY